MICNCLQGAVFSDGGSCVVIRSIKSEMPDKVPGSSPHCQTQQTGTY